MNCTTKLIFILSLICSINAHSLVERRKTYHRNSRKNQLIENAIKSVTASFQQLNIKSKDSKIFNFFSGAVQQFMENAQNPVLNSIVCVIAAVNGYKQYKADLNKSEEEKNQALITEGANLAAEISQIEAHEEIFDMQGTVANKDIDDIATATYGLSLEEESEDDQEIDEEDKAEAKITGQPIVKKKDLEHGLKEGYQELFMLFKMN